MNKRVHPRFYFDKPISGRLFINEIKGKVSDNKYTPIEIINISSGGLCFKSILNFPNTRDYLLQIRFSEEVLRGNIVWRHNKHSYYLYGFKIESSSIGYLQLFNVLKKAK
ncbi:PilZ domain-containing protein [Bacillus nitroreducens]